MIRLLCIPLLLSCYMAVGQYRQLVDSLNNQLLVTKQDTVKAMTLSELAFQYRFANTDTAMNYAQHALKLSRQINYRAGEAAALNNIAFLFREKGNLALSMELHFKVQQIALDNHLYNEYGISMMRLGNIYRDLKDYTTALDYQRRAMGIFENTHYKRGITIATMLIGQTFQETNKLDSALYYEQQAMSLADTIKLSDVTTTMLNNLGKIYAKLHNYPVALSYYRQCADISLLFNDHRSLSQLYSNMAQLYDELKQSDSSIYYADMALSKATLVANKVGILNAATILSQIYEPVDIKKSLEYYKIAVAAKDSLYGNEKILALQTVKFNEQERQQNFEIDKKAYQDKIKQYALIAGLAGVIVIALVLYRNNRQKQHANIVLNNTLANLKTTQMQLIQSEKMASLGELTAGIAHEIQNPLNFVNNFSEVNTELLAEMNAEVEKGNLSEVKQIAKDLTDNEQKINYHGKRADAIVKGMLQHSRSSSGHKELTDINALAEEYLRLSYQGFRAKDKSFNATIKTDFDETIGKINIIPQDIGRVLLNLYNNAFYAVKPPNPLKGASGTNDKYEPIVTVSTKAVKPPSGGLGVVITVRDNGSGIPQNIIDKIFQPFFTTKPTGQGTGLGLSLSYDIIKAHGGEIKVETKEREFTEFIIQLPIV